MGHNEVMDVFLTTVPQSTACRVSMIFSLHLFQDMSCGFAGKPWGTHLGPVQLVVDLVVDRFRTLFTLGFIKDFRNE